LASKDEHMILRNVRRP